MKLELSLKNGKTVELYTNDELYLRDIESDIVRVWKERKTYYHISNNDIERIRSVGDATTKNSLIDELEVISYSITHYAPDTDCYGNKIADKEKYKKC